MHSVSAAQGVSWLPATSTPQEGLTYGRFITALKWDMVYSRMQAVAWAIIPLSLLILSLVIPAIMGVGLLSIGVSITFQVILALVHPAYKRAKLCWEAAHQTQNRIDSQKKDFASSLLTLSLRQTEMVFPLMNRQQRKVAILYMKPEHVEQILAKASPSQREEFRKAAKEHYLFLCERYRTFNNEIEGLIWEMSVHQTPQQYQFFKKKIDQQGCHLKKLMKSFCWQNTAAICRGDESFLKEARVLSQHYGEFWAIYFEEEHGFFAKSCRSVEVDGSQNFGIFALQEALGEASPSVLLQKLNHKGISLHHLKILSLDRYDQVQKVLRLANPDEEPLDCLKRAAILWALKRFIGHVRAADWWETHHYLEKEIFAAPLQEILQDSVCEILGKKFHITYEKLKRELVQWNMPLSTVVDQWLLANEPLNAWVESVKDLKSWLSAHTLARQFKKRDAIHEMDIRGISWDTVLEMPMQDIVEIEPE